MASDPIPAGAATLRRLHPFSWLFVLLTRLRPIVLPLLVLLFLGQGEWWELFIVAGAVGYALYSLIYSIGFRYRIGTDELLVKEGIFSRTERHIPYARIQNIVRRRNPLHRIFGVAELRLESAGGTSPEAVMNVITLAAAEELEAVLRSGHNDAAAPADAATHPLHALSPAEVLRLGLLRNRGGVLIGAMFAAAWQFGAWESMSVRDAVRTVGGWLFAGTQSFTGPLAMFFSIVALSLLLYVAIKLFSIAMAFLEFHGFQLRSDGSRVATEGGLLTRHAASARVEKIQRLVTGDSWLSRRLGRRWLSCEVASGLQLDDENRSSRLQWLAPIGTPAKIDEIVAVLDAGLVLHQQQWQPLHPRAWRRVAKTGALMWTLGTLPAWYLLGLYAVPVWLALMVVNYFGARGWARFAAYSCHDGVFAYRSGWLSREWLLTRIAKGQGIELSSSPFDRRAGMAKVELDTAGASQIGSRLQVPYLGQAQARALMAALRSQIDALPLPALAAPSEGTDGRLASRQLHL